MLKDNNITTNTKQSINNFHIMTFFCYLVDIESISAALHEAGLRHQLARPPPLNPVLTLREEQGPGQLIC